MFHRILHHRTRDLLALVEGGRFAVINPSTNEIILAPKTCLEASEKSNVVIKSPLDDSEFHKQPVRAIAWAPEEPFLVTIGEEKILKLWNIESGTCLGSCSLEKRINAVVFSRDGSKILIADKFGDVFEVAVNEQTISDAPPKLLLGHISMLTDICTSVDDRFIITADRDDHVRVTHYPRTHVILNWCLGHTQFISQIQLLPNFPDYLLSAGGDDTLLLWKWPTAQLVQTVQLEGVVSSLATNPSSVSEQSTVSSLRVSANGSCIVLLCEDLRHVVVYTVAVLNGTPHVSFSRTVELRAQPLDATFSNDGNLYVSLVEGNGVDVLKWNDTNEKSAPLSHSTIGLDLGTLGWKEKYDLFPTGKWRKEFDYGNEEGEGDRDDSGEEEGADAEEKGKKKKKTKR